MLTSYGTSTCKGMDGHTQKRRRILQSNSFLDSLLCQFFVKTCATKKRFTQFIKYLIRLFLFLIFFGVSSMIGKIVTMVFVVPRVDVHAPPASDILLDAFSHANPQAFKATEIMTACLVFLLVIISVVHGRERSFILYRFLFISGTLINLRTLCISITTFSIPSRELSHQCSKLQELTQDKLLWKSVNFFEFSETCGDYVFSGHATALIIVAWFVWYYGRSISIVSSKFPPVFNKLMNFLLVSLVIVGCMCILFAKEHYSVDVVLGGVISIMWCILYHLLLEGYRRQCEEKHVGEEIEKCGKCSVQLCIHLWFRMVEGNWKKHEDSESVYDIL